jgi:hypothetical protein
MRPESETPFGSLRFGSRSSHASVGEGESEREPGRDMTIFCRRMLSPIGIDFDHAGATRIASARPLVVDDNVAANPVD